jgi:hypothetical protein
MLIASMLLIAFQLTVKTIAFVYRILPQASTGSTANRFDLVPSLVAFPFAYV